MLTTKTIPSVFGDFDKKENSTHLIEANIKVIFSTTFASRGFEKYKNRNENNNNFQFPIQIGIASILLFFLLLVFAHFIKKLVRRQKTKGIQTLKPKDFSSESDHYHSLGNIEQSYPLHHDNDVVFDGVAEVKIKYDTETKTFKVGFQTKQSNQEGRNRGAAFDIMKSADTIKLKECCSLPVANVNMNMAYMSPESIEEQLPLIPHPQNESKRKDEDFGNPYLIAVKDD
ncbi:uncharacterized protein LOC134257527 [Saccostrea cucullata]|uniref:uncharacterized protein LOC134257527 n=1 Tax=Saccostrea cuccullata TaxID=36930 RepID=UPI002ED5C7AF